MSADLNHHSWLYRKAILPVLALLRMGASPEKLAWSLAIGLAIGINPILGSTTALSLALAFAFKLNVPASQITTHLSYPLELICVLPLIRLGARIFHTAPIPLDPKQLIAAARTAPWQLTKSLWMWEWHALIVYLPIAAILVPLTALAITPTLRKALAKMESHGHPHPHLHPHK